MMKMKIKKGDEVIVITGKDKGKKGEVVKAIPSDGKVVVKGVNMVKRHTKPSQTSAGGVIAKEAPLDISNVALLDPKDGKPTRVGVKIMEDGRKVRIAKKSGSVIDA